MTKSAIIMIRSMMSLSLFSTFGISCNAFLHSHYDYQGTTISLHKTTISRRKFDNKLTFKNVTETFQIKHVNVRKKLLSYASVLISLCLSLTSMHVMFCKKNVQR